MNKFRTIIQLIVIGLFIAMQAGKAGSTTIVSNFSGIRVHSWRSGASSQTAPVYKTIYGFGAHIPSLAQPGSDLLVANGELLGTANSAIFSSENGGVFSVTSAGAGRVINYFPGGSGPFSGLTELGGKFYGTTAYTGSGGCGAVFEVSSSGWRVVYAFAKAGRSNDACHPSADLIPYNGVLYGTAPDGGTKDFGALFAVTPSGIERVLYSFGTKANDGVEPEAGLVALDGKLYGTTKVGGVDDRGVVYSVTPSGQEHVVYSFRGPPDGLSPVAALIAVSGTLFGTTQSGGMGKPGACGGQGCGTVFEVTASGKERVLYSFKDTPDGYGPVGRLVASNGLLYGTTLGGGIDTNPNCFVSCGTVFSLTEKGVESVLHRFGSSATDGYSPIAGLTLFDGVLFGTAQYGGPYGTQFGGGTVFAIKL